MRHFPPDPSIVNPVARTCAVLGLGGLFLAPTGPLLSAYVPPLVESALGEDRVGIGLVMAIDNLLLLLLLPLTGAASDRARAAAAAGCH